MAPHAAQAAPTAATSPTPVARTVGVRLRYGKTEALAGIDLDLPAGCMVGLIGPDGVGKSSLLALLAGARALQEGQVQVLGGDMAQRTHGEIMNWVRGFKSLAVERFVDGGLGDVAFVGHAKNVGLDDDWHG